MSVRLPTTDAPAPCPVCYNNTLCEDEPVCGERVYWCSSCASLILEQDLLEENVCCNTEQDWEALQGATVGHLGDEVDVQVDIQIDGLCVADG